MMKYFQKVDVPEGESGDWKVERYTVTAKDLMITNMRIMFAPGMAHRTIDPGTYTKLTCRGRIVMTDTKAEIYENYEPVFQAKGDVLLNGLGLGVVLLALLNKPDVNDITVVEKSKDVLDLVGPHYQCPRVKFIHADARQWRPAKGTRFSVVWHDIWNDICEDNLDEMKFLHRAYGRRCDWQGSWSRKYL